MSSFMLAAGPDQQVTAYVRDNIAQHQRRQHYSVDDLKWPAFSFDPESDAAWPKLKTVLAFMDSDLACDFISDVAPTLQKWAKSNRSHKFLAEQPVAAYDYHAAKAVTALVSEKKVSTDGIVVHITPLEMLVAYVFLAQPTAWPSIMAAAAFVENQYARIVRRERCGLVIPKGYQRPACALSFFHLGPKTGLSERHENVNTGAPSLEDSTTLESNAPETSASMTLKPNAHGPTSSSADGGRIEAPPSCRARRPPSTVTATTLLEDSLSDEESVRQVAEAQFEHAICERYYMTMMIALLANEEMGGCVRFAAGMAAIRGLSEWKSLSKAQAAKSWIDLPRNTRSNIKAKALRTLALSSDVLAQTSAQLIAAIACIEFPEGQWSECIPQLLYAASDSQNRRLRRVALQAIGLICQGSCESDVLQAHSQEAIAVIVQTARNEEPYPRLQIAALQALANLSTLAQPSFASEKERNYIMQIICEAAQSEQLLVSCAAYGVLSIIIQLYYDKMKMYMEQALFGLTVLAISDAHPMVKIGAIDFWTCACEHELCLSIEAEQGDEEDNFSAQPFYAFSQVACSRIVPSLLSALKVEDEGASDEQWTLAKAAGTCLKVFSQCVRDDIVPIVVPFIETNIQSADWREREAALTAFGSILMGPSEPMLTPLVRSSLPALIAMFNDPSTFVQETLAWTFALVTDLHAETIAPETVLPALVTSLEHTIKEQSSTAAYYCAWTLQNLCEQFLGADQETAPLSSSMPLIIRALVRVLGTHTDKNNAATVAFQAAAAAATHAPKDTRSSCQQLIQIFLQRLNFLGASMPEKAVARASWVEQESNLCFVLAAAVRRLGPEGASMAEKVAGDLIPFLQAGQTLLWEMPHGLENIFLTIGASVSCLGKAFDKYLSEVEPYVLAALRSRENVALCKIAVGLVGDIGVAMGKACNPYLDTWIKVLCDHLSSSELDREIQPAILSCLGDLASAVGAWYEPYLSATMTILVQADTMRGHMYDAETFEYVHLLRQGICDAYVGIVSGLKAEGRSDLLAPYVEAILLFILHVEEDEFRSEELLSSALGLLGDLATIFPRGQLAPALTQPWVAKLIRTGRSKLNLSHTRQVATWARDNVSKALIIPKD